MIPELSRPDQRITLPRFPRWIGFIALCIGMGMAILDIQVVVTSLKVISKAFQIGDDQISWVQTAYLIAEVIAIPLTGLLMRVFTLRWLLLASLVFFILASIFCAYSNSYVELLVGRIAQGFAGGVLIPIVFTAIFLLFPPSIEQSLATTLAGFLAVLAPTLGPLIGGWLTEHYTWHALFLINVPPGILAIAMGYFALPQQPINTAELRGLDYLSLGLLGVGLSALLIGMKYAPQDGWLALHVLAWFGLSAAALWWLWKRPNPAVMFHLLEDRSLGFGCMLSFLTGFVLYANIFLIPFFLASVRGYGPLAIGLTTLVMGLSQLFTAPISVQIDRYSNARILSAVGFVTFGIGLFMNADLTLLSDRETFFWPQLVRGVASAFIVLPPIRFALALMPLDKVGDASGLFNLARNMGGALGIAVVDTMIWQRSPVYSDQVNEWIKTEPEKAAVALGMPLSDVPAPNDAMGMMSITDAIGQFGITGAINESWILLGCVSLLALPVLWWLGPVASAMPPKKLKLLKGKNGSR